MIAVGSVVKQITFQDLWPRSNLFIKIARSVVSKNRDERFESVTLAARRKECCLAFFFVAELPPKRSV